MWDMPKKQKATHDYRLSTITIPDLADGLTKARMRLNLRAVKHQKRKLKDGPLLNALVAWFLAQSEDDQADVAIDGLTKYEAMLSGEVHSPDNPRSGIAAGASPTLPLPPPPPDPGTPGKGPGPLVRPPKKTRRHSS